MIVGAMVRADLKERHLAELRLEEIEVSVTVPLDKCSSISRSLRDDYLLVSWPWRKGLRGEDALTLCQHN